MNEYVHDASDEDLRSFIVQVTGAEPSSSTVSGIFGSFKALRAQANFDVIPEKEPSDELALGPKNETLGAGGMTGSIKLGYTINLYLPATSDITVFDAIFKSLRQNLL